jgi:hypothetical protein
MNYLTTKQVVELAGKSHPRVITNAIEKGYLNATRHGWVWLVHDDEKLRQYIDNPPKRGARKKG